MSEAINRRRLVQILVTAKDNCLMANSEEYGMASDAVDELKDLNDMIQQIKAGAKLNEDDEVTG